MWHKACGTPMSTWRIKGRAETSMFWQLNCALCIWISISSTANQSSEFGQVAEERHEKLWPADRLGLYLHWILWRGRKNGLLKIQRKHMEQRFGFFTSVVACSCLQQLEFSLADIYWHTAITRHNRIPWWLSGNIRTECHFSCLQGFIHLQAPAFSNISYIRRYLSVVRAFTERTSITRRATNKSY